MCAEPVSAGLLDLRIGAPAYTWSGDTPTIANVIPLGIATDTIDISPQPYFFDIHTDRNGGQAGPPTEVQYLGEIVNINMVLATWNPLAYTALRRNLVNATRGVILQSEVGSMMLRTRSIRLLINTADTDNVRNFWCCLVRQAHRVGMGTKWAELHVSLTAYRPPCYHPKANILEDADATTGVPTP